MALRSLLGVPAGGGGKRPKLTFIGWNVSAMAPPVMCASSAPCAVSGGGGAGATVDANGYVHGGLPEDQWTGTTAAGEGQVGIGGTYGLGSTVSPHTGGRGGNGGAPATAGSPGRLLDDSGDGNAGGAAGAEAEDIGFIG